MGFKYRPNIYLDMDGVLADFDKGCLQNGIQNRNDLIYKPREQWTAEENLLRNKVEDLMSSPGFFYNLPVFSYTDPLWVYSNTVANTFILTARPLFVNGPEGRIPAEKLEWCRKNLPNFKDEQFICCLRPEKSKYALDNILVDDMKKNCEEWKEKGGVAILHTSYDVTADALGELFDYRAA